VAAGLYNYLLLLGLSTPTSPPVIAIPEAVPIVIPLTFKQAGLNIAYSDPLLKTNRQSYLGSLSDQIDSYTHEIRSVGGFYSASMSFKTTDVISQDWIMNGVGRHIEVFNPAQQIVWEGLVDKVTMNIGNFSISVGPLITKEVANRVKIKYSIVDYSISPPSAGITLTSVAVDNDASQSKYGIIERTLSGNELTETLAEAIRDSWLTEHAFPPIVVSSTLLGNSEPTLTIDCLGYWNYLSTWTYSNTTAGGQTIRNKIIAVLESCPTTIFPENYTRIGENTTEVSRADNNGRTPDTILTELTSLGDSSNSRYTIGFYANRQLVYQPIPTSVDYVQYVGAGISTLDGRRVNSWDIVPGKWIYYTGFLRPRPIPTTLEALSSDPGSGLIENVTFTAPGDVSLTSARFSKLDQLFARMGMSGI
jgi:hypothetical protein